MFLEMRNSTGFFDDFNYDFSDGIDAEVFPEVLPDMFPDITPLPGMEDIDEDEFDDLNFEEDEFSEIDGASNCHRGGGCGGKSTPER